MYNVFGALDLRKGDGLVRNVPKKADIFDGVSEGLSFFLVPWDTEV